MESVYKLLETPTGVEHYHKDFLPETAKPADMLS